MALENHASLFGILSAIVAITATAVVPGWHFLIKKFGKVPTFRGTCVFCVASALLNIGATYTSGPYVVIVAAMLFGMFLSGETIISNIFLADVIDYDQLHSGKRREGVYLNISRFPGQLVSIAGSAIPLALMDQFGYVADGQVQPQAVVELLRFWATGIPALVGIGAGLVLWNFQITETKHAEILRGIERIEQGEVGVMDPILGSCDFGFCCYFFASQ